MSDFISNLVNALNRPPATDMEKAMMDTLYVLLPNVDGMPPVGHRAIFDALQRADPRPAIGYYIHPPKPRSQRDNDVHYNQRGM